MSQRWQSAQVAYRQLKGEGLDLRIPRLVVAGTQSGVGKTTLALALMAAFTQRGKRVQPFKNGPDYIDAGYHGQVTGRHSRNLDTWMISQAGNRELFCHAVQGADIAIIEGAMGLYDGQGSLDERGSTAHLSKVLSAPVLLVLDARRLSRSGAAMVLGYRAFDDRVRIAGILLNQTGSEKHGRWLREAIEHHTNLPVLGDLPREEELRLPERHLGLVIAEERPLAAEFIERLAQTARAHFDLEGIEKIAAAAPSLHPPVGQLFPPEGVRQRVPLGIARDEAFSFYYPDNLDLLVAWGADLCYFSPLKEDGLPEGICGLFLGGGYPEIHAEALSQNRRLHEEIREAASRGMAIYAECGGYIYASQGIRDFEGRLHPLLGLLPCRMRMEGRRQALGYAEAEVATENILSKRGEVLRGHEFHWSRIEGEMAPPHPAYRIRGRDGEEARVEGWVQQSLLASYLHLHFGSYPPLARRFVERCLKFQERNRYEGGNHRPRPR